MFNQPIMTTTLSCQVYICRLEGAPAVTSYTPE